MLMPHMAAEKSPTAESTENRPADAIRDQQGEPAGLVGHFAERAAARVGGHDELFGQPLFAELLRQQGADDLELRRGLGGLPRLADDVEDCLLEVGTDYIDEVGELDRVDVVHDEQARAVAFAGGKQVVQRWVERGLQRDVAQRRAADTEHDQVLAAALVLAGGGLNVGEHRAVVRQIAVAVLAALSLAFDRGDDLLDRGLGAFDLSGSQAVGGSDGRVEQIGVVQF